MPRLSNHVWLAVACLVLASQAHSWAAVPATESVLPDATKGFLAVGSIDQLSESWNKTQLGQLTNDPVMKPFMDDLQRQIQQKWTQTHHKLGITWDDLSGVPTRRSCRRPDSGRRRRKSRVAVLADVTGNLPKANALLDKIQQNLTEQKAVRSQRNVQGTSVTVFNIPKREEEPARQMIYFIKDDLLVASDNLKVIDGILAGWAKLAPTAWPAWRPSRPSPRAAEPAAGELAPHVRWFVEPFGYADATRLSSGTAPSQGHRHAQNSQEQGFTAIQGIGGFVNFATADYEILHRTYIHAPGNKAGGDRFALAARMLALAERRQIHAARLGAPRRGQLMRPST